MIDHGRILDDLVEASKVFTIESIGYDPAQATMLVTEMMAEDLPVVEGDLGRQRVEAEESALGRVVARVRLARRLDL